jgi:RNA polymerase sigma-70 factor (ECF subfamily)
MVTHEQEQRGLAALRLALWRALDPAAFLALDGLPVQTPRGRALFGPTHPRRVQAGWLLSETVHVGPGREPAGQGGPPSDSRYSDGRYAGAWASAADHDEAERIVALVELARGGDAEAFGMLYDHYHVPVYRYVYYRVGSVALAEDLTSETFFRALRGMSTFRWQGKDFGAWLTTIARNLTTDHFKAGRTRLEHVTEDMTPHDASVDGPETTVLASLTNQALLAALKELPREQQECLVMRFLQGLSIAETAKVLGRSDGAVKQLQLRAVRNLAKLLPEGL